MKPEECWLQGYREGLLKRHFLAPKSSVNYVTLDIHLRIVEVLFAMEMVGFFFLINYFCCKWHPLHSCPELAQLLAARFWCVGFDPVSVAL